MSRRLTSHYPLTAVAVPMAVWAVHFVVVYSLVGLGCERGVLLQTVAMLPLLSWVLVLVTLAALATIAWLGWRAWRRWSAPGPEQAPRVQPRERFMRLVTAMLAVLAFVAVVFTATPIFMLPPCT
ncbi:MAG: tellurite resistance TerB family protein [Pseudomonadota bacterium]|nr:tellurite resistance TerB family protein [Pseudomonadota bacterium]